MSQVRARSTPAPTLLQSLRISTCLTVPALSLPFEPRRCSELIAKDSVRIGVPIKWRGGLFGWISSWQHPAACACQASPGTSSAANCTALTLSRTSRRMKSSTSSPATKESNWKRWTRTTRLSPSAKTRSRTSCPRRAHETASAVSEGGSWLDGCERGWSSAWWNPRGRDGHGQNDSDDLASATR